MPEGVWIAVIASGFAFYGALLLWLIRGGPLKPLLVGLQSDLKELTRTVGALERTFAGQSPLLDGLSHRIQQNEERLNGHGERLKSLEQDLAVLRSKGAL